MVAVASVPAIGVPVADVSVVKAFLFNIFLALVPFPLVEIIIQRLQLA